MPYIDSEFRRESLSNRTSAPRDAGELNFTLTSICIEYLELNGLRYANVNEVIGALECAKLELYRRVAAPYEDTKIAENGDVYPPALLSDS